MVSVPMAQRIIQINNEIVDQVLAIIEGDSK